MSTLLLFIGGTGSNWNWQIVNWLTFPFPFGLSSRLKSLGVKARQPNKSRENLGTA